MERVLEEQLNFRVFLSEHFLDHSAVAGSRFPFSEVSFEVLTKFEPANHRFLEAEAGAAGGGAGPMFTPPYRPAAALMQ